MQIILNPIINKRQAAVAIAVSITGFIGLPTAINFKNRLDDAAETRNEPVIRDFTAVYQTRAPAITANFLQAMRHFSADYKKRQPFTKPTFFNSGYLANQHPAINLSRVWSENDALKAEFICWQPVASNTDFHIPNLDAIGTGYSVIADINRRGEFRGIETLHPVGIKLSLMSKVSVTQNPLSNAGIYCANDNGQINLTTMYVGSHDIISINPMPDRRSYISTCHFKNFYWPSSAIKRQLAAQRGEMPATHTP